MDNDNTIMVDVQTTVDGATSIEPMTDSSSEDNLLNNPEKPKKKKKDSRIKSFFKYNKILIVTYLIFLAAAGAAVYFIMEDRIASSLRSIEYKTSFSGNCISYGNGRTITSYEKAEVPSLKDKTDQEQMYGNVKSYYKVSGSTWGITYLKKDSEHTWELYSIKPIAAGLYANSSVNVGDAFSNLYDSLTDNDDLNCSKSNEYIIDNFASQKSKYHHISFETTEFGSESFSTWWKTWYSYKVYYEYNCRREYTIEESTDEIIKSYVIFGLIAFLLVTAIVYLASLISKHVRLSKEHNLSTAEIQSRARALNDGQTSTQSPIPPSISLENHESLSSSDLNERFERIKLAINPVQFMAPYDAEKVRIANDLYEALLKNKENETILDMIEEKAKKSLGVTI